MLGMKKAVKKPVGMKLINSVVDRFQTMIDDLSDGVQDCASEQNNITITIANLRERNNALHDSTKRANVIIDNLRNLVSG